MLVGEGELYFEAVDLISNDIGISNDVAKMKVGYIGIPVLLSSL